MTDQLTVIAALELSLRCLAAVVLIAGTFDCAYRVAWRCVDDDEFLLRWTGAGVVGMWLATVGFHASFALSAFNLPVAVGAVALIAFATRRFVLPGATGALLARDWALVKRAGAAPDGGRGARVLFFFAPFAALLLARCLILPPLAWDWITYHGVRAAQFVQGESWTLPDGPGSWAVYRHFFAGSEVLSAWALLPFRSDLLASSAEWVQWLALGTAVAALARLLKLGWEAVAVAACAALFVPSVRLMVPSGYTELELNFAIVATVAFSVAYLQKAQPAYLLMTLVAAGVAAGIKPTGALPCAVASAFAVAAALGSRRHRGRTTLAALLLGTVLALLVPLPWLALAVRDTGLPFSPLPVSVLGIELGVTNLEMQVYQDRNVSGALTLSGELAALRSVFAPLASRKEALGILTLVPVCLFPVGVIAELLRRRRVEVLVPFVTALAVVAFYYLPGFAVVRLHQSTSSSRFLVGLALFALPVSLLAFDRWPRLQRAYAMVLFGIHAYYAIWYATFGVARFEPEYLVRIAACVGITAAAIYVLAGRVRWSRATAAAAVALACFGAVRLQGAQDSARDQAMAEPAQLHGQNRYWSEAVALVDDPAEPRVLAVTAAPHRNSDHWFAYFFLGRRLQNRLIYVPITADGSVHHAAPGGERRAHGDRAAWLARVVTSPASEVLCFRPLSIEQEWMESDPQHFEKLAGGARWGLFRVLRDAPVTSSEEGG